MYNRDEHRQQAMRFGVDLAVSILSHRSRALWFLGYPEIALADAERALHEAREIGHAGTLMYALQFASSTHVYCGEYRAATALIGEVLALASKKRAMQWESLECCCKVGYCSNGQKLGSGSNDFFRNSGIPLVRSKSNRSIFLSQLANAHAELGQLDEATRCIGEAITAEESSKESCWQPEINRIAGEIALMSPEPDAAKAKPISSGARSCASAASPVLGATHRNEHGASLARPG